MAKYCGFESMDALVHATVPEDIKLSKPMDMGEWTEPLSESEFLSMFKAMASKNEVFKSYQGTGYYGTHVPPVILRNVLENPGWYTQYTPYQAEISQGRLESLLNYQTMISDLTALPMANASLLDEGTAAAEAMTMCSAINRGKKPKFLVSDKCHPQTIAVCETRADGLGLEVVVVDEAAFDFSKNDVCGVLLQYPATTGAVLDYSGVVSKAHAAGALVVAAADLLALTKLTPPGEWGADICIGSAQRFGVPMGFGGPHAGYLATSQEYKRLMPGRIIGVSIDADGNPALRMAMQTREQHIRRDKATSNICTAQALLANMAGLYGVYHGPEGLTAIADKTHALASIFAEGAARMSSRNPRTNFSTPSRSVPLGRGQSRRGLRRGQDQHPQARSEHRRAELRRDHDPGRRRRSVRGSERREGARVHRRVARARGFAVDVFGAVGAFMTHPVFNAYHSEHEMVRYLARLEAKDLSLVHSMIALGSCTMKLNSTTEMIPITWPELANMHPFAPESQTAGYREMFAALTKQLVEITGFDDMSLQPNSGASGEYAGLMAIRAYHQSRGDAHRRRVHHPVSAHGTNPASAAMVGIQNRRRRHRRRDGNINVPELKAAAEKHSANLAALMVTYPSTHGVYEDGIKEVCDTIHAHGGQVYMDGANMNAQVGLTSPGHIGADVCHLNLHKTFCIPHGGGGPGMGPIGVKAHLAPFMPDHPSAKLDGATPAGGATPFGVVSAAPCGSALILPISFAYISMMGAAGLTNASKRAILNANYMAKRLEDHYPVLFRGKNGTCAHEFIIDLRPMKDSCGVEAEDVAKRLQDYGYHAPTMSWPVTGTLMIEPTESESKAELDRFCNAMIAIREEVRTSRTAPSTRRTTRSSARPTPRRRC